MKTTSMFYVTQDDLFDFMICAIAVAMAVMGLLHIWQAFAGPAFASAGVSVSEPMAAYIVEAVLLVLAALVIAILRKLMPTFEAFTGRRVSDSDMMRLEKSVVRFALLPTEKLERFVMKHSVDLGSERINGVVGKVQHHFPEAIKRFGWGPEDIADFVLAELTKNGIDPAKEPGQ